MSSDIDFDELDKAVSSLMGGVGAEKPDDTPKQKTLTISGTLKPDEDPAYTKLDEVARTIGSETLTTDSEKTVTVDDVSPVAVPEVVPATPSAQGAAKPVELPVPVAPMVPAPTTIPMPAVQRPSTGRFMDVVHPSSAMRGTATLDTTPPIRTAPLQATPSQGVESVSDAPLTPFLPDAKVEKRPLGSSGAIPSPFDDTPTRQPSVVSEVDVHETSAINSEPRQVDASNDTQPVLDASAFEQGTAESAELSAVESTEVSPETTSKASSIASVESGDTEHLKNPQLPGQQGAIYDVDNQPQPLAHPTKQKSGWGTVVIIVLIIVLAAAVGAAAYFILGLGV